MAVAVAEAAPVELGVVETPVRAPAELEPKETCPTCGDVLFTPRTVRRIEELLAALPEPMETVPLFEFAS